MVLPIKQGVSQALFDDVMSFFQTMWICQLGLGVLNQSLKKQSFIEKKLDCFMLLEDFSF